MYKFLFGLVLSLLLTSSVSAAEFNSNLKFGSKGADVVKLQEFLVEQDLYSGPITGNFFSLTLKAVKSFQTRESITPISGFFGSLTRAKANLILDQQLIDSESETEPVDMGNPVSAEVLRLNELLGAVREQNQLLQGSLDLQRSEADRLRAEREAEAARLRAIADKADAEANARQQAELTARVLAEQQAETDRLKAAEKARVDAELARQKAEAEAVAPYYSSQQMASMLRSTLSVISSICQPCATPENGEASRVYAVSFRIKSWADWRDKYRVVFNGQTIIEGETVTHPVIINNLNPGQTYTYQVIYPGEGRHADSVYNGKFTIASSEPFMSQIQRWDGYGGDKFGTDGWGFLNPQY